MVSGYHSSFPGPRAIAASTAEVEQSWRMYMNSRYKAAYDFDSDMARATGFLLLTSPSASASSPNLFYEA